MEPTAKPMPPTGPGELLRHAREERRLTIDDVAQELRLSPRLVAALEEDAYDRLPGPTYVRGYLRSYAQFLKLSPERLIDAFNARPEATQPADMTAPAPVRQATSSDVAVRLGTVVVIVVVLGLVALWWGQKAPERSPVAAIAESTGTPPEETAPAPEPTEPLPSVEAAAATPAPSAPEPEAPDTALVAPEPAEAEPEPDIAVRTEPPPIDPNVPVSRVVLYVHEDSWADVRDARQQRLLYQTVPAGSVVTVEGVAPISVFLGNVAGVTVEFDGKPYDALRHRRGDVARFTLGTPSG